MHEMSIVIELVEQVLSVAKEHQAVKIESVSVACGQMRMVVPEAMDMAFLAVIKGTIAEGAHLELREEPMKARCNLCTFEFAPEIDRYLCPRCKEADVEILNGNDIILESVICHAEDEGEDSL